MLASILINKLNEGFRCLYLNSSAMVAGMRSTLASMDVDVTLEMAKGRLILSSDPVSSGHNFNADEMLRKIEDSLDEALNNGYRGLWATGDMSWEFGPARDFLKLLEYEWRLEELFHKRNQLCGICQYHKDTLPQEVMRNSLLTHPTIIINETLARINPHYLRSQKDAVLNTLTSEQDAMISALCELRNTGS